MRGVHVALTTLVAAACAAGSFAACGTTLPAPQAGPSDGSSDVTSDVTSGLFPSDASEAPDGVGVSPGDGFDAAICVGLPPTDAGDAGGDGGACRTDKMTFTQANGCGNDGSFEFCMPASDDALRCAAYAIAPQLRCYTGGGGRAACNVGEMLCMYPTPPPNDAGGEQTCVTAKGAMTDATWADVCALAALPGTRSFTETFLE